MSEPTTAAGRRLIDALDLLVAFVAELAVADLPEALTDQVKGPTDIRKALLRTIAEVETEAYERGFAARSRTDQGGQP